MLGPRDGLLFLSRIEEGFPYQNFDGSNPTIIYGR
jgi:hypothetical protein